MNNISLSVKNVVAANGIIHIIDTAIMPASEDLVVGNRSVSSGFSIITETSLLHVAQPSHCVEV